MQEQYRRVYALSDKWVSSAKSSDRSGGVSKQSFDKIKAQMTKYGTLLEQTGSEVARIQELRGLPLEFWNVVRGETLKTVQLWLEVDKKVSDDFKRHLTSVEELFEEFGPVRVLLIEMPGTSAEKTAEIAAKLKAKIGTSAKVVESSANGEATINIGPVDDFDKFVAGIDFGTVTDKDPGQRMVEIHTGPAPMEAQASFDPPPAPSPSIDSPSWPVPTDRPQAASEDGSREVPPSRIDPAQVAGRIAALAERRREERDFPSSSDPEYHKKLCDLMVDTENWTLNDDAVDALLKIQPQDIQDKAVRQQIARNFRELATKDSAANDQGKAIRGLVLYGGKYSVPVLVEILEDQSLKAPAELFDGLASFPDPKGAEALCKQLGNFFNHREAVHALRTMGVAAEDALMKAAPSDDAQTSLAAVELLGEVGTKKSLPLLAKAGKSTNLEVRAAAKDASKAIMDRSRTAK